MEYQVGATLPPQADSYVEREADEELFNSLCAGEFCYVFNARQMGKSSLRSQMEKRLTEAGIAWAVVDLQGIGTTLQEAHQWYSSVGKAISSSLDLQISWRRWWLERRRELDNPIQILEVFFREVVLVEIPAPQKVVILIDEIDIVRGLPFVLDDFFALLRSCHRRSDRPEYERLTFALFGVATPSNLLQSPLSTPFNIGKPIALEGLKLPKAGKLAQGLHQRVVNPNAVLEAILDWTGGQPFLTQKLCHLAQNCQEEVVPEGREQDWVEQLVQEHILTNWDSQDDPQHLKTIIQRLGILPDGSIDSEREKDVGRLLGLYQEILEKKSVAANEGAAEQVELRLSGLVVSKQGRLQVFNRIYQAVFNRQWVEEQLHKLRDPFYAEALSAWLKADKQDESRLLRGEALQGALQWKEGKRLSPVDEEFIEASQRYEGEETRRALEAEAEAKQILEEANRKSQRKILFGSVVLGLMVVAAIGSTIFAGQQVQNAQENEKRANSANKKLDSAQEQLASVEQKREQAETSRDQAEEQLDSTKEQLASTEQQKKQAESERQQAEQDLNQARQKTTEAETSLAQAVEALDLTQDQLASTEQQKQQAEQNLNQARQETTKAETSLDKAEEKLDSTKEELDSIEQQKKQAESELQQAEQDLQLAQKGTRLEQEGSSAFNRFESDPVGALLTAMRSASELNQLVKEHQIKNLEDYPAASPMLALKTILDKIWEPPRVLQSNQDAVTDIEFSPNGQILATASWDGTARIWDLQDKQLALFQGHEAAVRDIEFSPDGQRLATASLDGSARIWDLQGHQLALLQGHERDVRDIEFSPDGQRLATASQDGTARIWDLQGRQLALLQGHKEQLWEIEFSPDGQRLATASEDGTTRIWDLQGNQLTLLQGHQAPVKDIKFSPDGQRLATASEDRTVKIWDLQGKQIALLQGHESIVWNIEFSPDGERLATTSGDRTARIWDLQGRQLALLQGHQEALGEIKFSPEGQYIATGSLDGTARIWDLQGRQLNLLQGHQDWVVDIEFSPDGQSLVTASWDGTARIWDLQGRQPSLFQGHKASVRNIEFSRDGQHLATESWDGTARIWDLQGKQLALLQSQARVFEIEFSRDGQRLATGSEHGTARIWDLQGNQLAILQGHKRSIQDIKFSRDEERLATASRDGTVRIWNLQGRQIALLQGHKSAVWNIEFSPDGQRLATASLDGTARIWDLQGNQIALLQGHTDEVKDIEFSPDGQYIATASADGTARIWKVETLEQNLERGCRWLNAYLPYVDASEEDWQLCSSELIVPPPPDPLYIPSLDEATRQQFPIVD